MARKELSLDRDVMRSRLDRVSVHRGAPLQGRGVDELIREVSSRRQPTTPALPGGWLGRIAKAPGGAWRGLCFRFGR